MGDGVRAVGDAVNNIPLVGEVTKPCGNFFNSALMEVKKVPYLG